MIKSISYLLLCVLLMSCGDDLPTIEEITAEQQAAFEAQAAMDDMTIINYIDANGLEAEKTSSGLYYIITEPGGSEKPTATTNVEVCYRGYLLDGTEFDSSYNQSGVCSAINFNLSGVIQGWTEGIQLFGKGGEGILLIPSALGYGTTGNGPIPPNTVLGFDVHLIDF